MANTTSTVEKPQPGQSVPVTLTEGQTTVSCEAGDVASTEMLDGGKLLMKFTDGGSITINNFSELASQGSTLTLSDGTTVNTMELLSGVSLKAEPANDGAEILVGQPAAGQTVELELQAGQKYNFSFSEGAKDSVTQEAGALVITFDDGGKLVLKNFSDAMDASDPVQVSVAGDVITLGEFAEFLKLADAMNDKIGDEKPVEAALRQEAGEVIKVEPAAGDEVQKPESDKTSMQDVREATNEELALLAQQLAQVEPAAGGQGGSAGRSRGGFGFQSVVDSADVTPLTAIGPIAPTALQFGLPQFQDPLYIEEEEPVGPPNVTANLGFEDAIVKEDGSVFVPITASIGTNGDGNEVLTLTVTGFQPGWGLVFSDGAYNPATNTWTITMPPGTNYSGGFTFIPPANSDGDMPGLTATVTVFDPNTGGSQTATDTFNVITDAVADKPLVNAPDNGGVKNAALAVTITGSVTDTDGSETITHYQVSGVPNGFTFNQGTNLGNGTWQFTPAQLAGLTVTPPLNFVGTLPLTAIAYSGETPTDREIDFSDNTNSASDPFALTWTPTIAPPDITLNNQLDLVNAQVKEDGTVGIPLTAVLGAGFEPTEYLTVTVTGIPSNWGFTAPVGTYNPATGTWTVTVAPGQNLNTVLNFTPPANSDIDLSGLNATVVTTQPSSGLTASDSDGFGIIVDAVADVPTIDATNNTVPEGQPIAVTLNAALTDNDGSEVITGYQISGVPAGFTFNQGTNAGGGIWTFTPAQIAGLILTPTANYNGTLNLTATVFNTENPVSDGEFDPNDNNNQASDAFTLSWSPTINPPDITVNNGIDDAQVKEDGSVTIPVTATLGAGAAPGEFLTVTVTGVPANWGFTAPVGTYNPATGTWTVTVPANTNLNTTMTFTPPANSDLDLSGLTATVVSTDPTSGLTATANDPFGIITDAVADAPLVNAPDNGGVKNTPLAVTITGSVTDNDGSEAITHYQVSGVPNGFTFNQGQNLGGGIWQFTPAQLAGLTVTPPLNFIGTLPLTATAFSGEVNLGGVEVDTTDNTNSASDPFTLTWTPTITPPDVTLNNQLDLVNAQVKEDGTVGIPLTAVLGAGAEAGEFLTVTVTGIPSTWGFNAPVGTYNPATGTWTITMPANTNLNTVLTFTPPANSDIDLSGLNATAVTTQPSSGLTASDADGFGIVVDAVADVPTIDATNNTVPEGQPIAVTLNAALTDNDGSEVITGYQISGVPAGFTFNQGTNAGGGIWTFTPAQIAGLILTPTANYNGTLNLTATVFNTENPVSDGEFDPNDNNNQASDAFTLSWSPTINPPAITVNNGVDNAVVKEDGTVTVPVTATLGANPAPGEFLTVTVTGIPANWGFTSPVGTYNPATGTWTVTLPPGQNLNSTMTFTPPANSDVDLGGLTATVVSTDPTSGLTATANDPFGIVVDAVADKPVVDAPDNSGVKNTPLAVNITGGLTDNDGSEAITHYQVSGVPNGFVFNQGTNLGNGIWQFTPAQLVGLTVTPPLNFIGTLPLTATAFSGEVNLGGVEVDTTDNTNSASDPFALTWTPTITPPDITLNNQLDLVNAQVKEDGTVGIPLTAVLGAGFEPTEYLTVTVTGIPSNWGFTAPVGTYNPATGTWTVTVAPGQNLNTVLNFTPPANSDIDLSGLNATVVTTQPSSGLTASDSDGFGIIVDAVADVPTIDATNNTVPEGQPIAVTLNAALTDNDGSEVITGYQISGVPAGFTFNQGTNAGGGIWTFTPAQIAGLILTPTANYNGTLNLTATVFNTENPVSDGEFDPNDNNNQASDAFTLSWSPTINPPDITVNNGIDDAQVKEDGSVTIPVTATLGAGAAPGEFLTVTVTGVPANWGFTAPVGTYNPATGTWTVTVPANTNLNTTMTFTPPANSDLDLSGLTATVVSTDPASGLTASDSDAFRIITDAVADVPTISASAPAVEEGQRIPLTINGGLTDNDGSEIITGYQISGVPAGYSFNQGTNVGGGVWTFTPAQIAGLQMITPAAGSGQFSVQVTVFNTENPVSDGEFDPNDNNSSATTTLAIQVNADDTPTLSAPAAVTVDETDMGSSPVVTNPVSTGGQLVADFKSDNPGTYGGTGGFNSSVPLTSGGVAVQVTYANGVYTGRAGATEVFTLTVATTGAYTFVLKDTLDHPNTADHNDNIALSFGASATDSDGDTVTTNITINVRDDGVDAVNDSGTFDAGVVGYTVVGNVTSNDDFSQDTPDRVTRIEFNGNGVNIPAAGDVTINGQYGSLTINSAGAYTYRTTSLNGVQDNFTYTLTDGDGDSDRATLTLNGIAPTLIVGQNVNDVPGSGTPWQVGPGSGQINGGGASDILIGDIGGTNVQQQNKDYNIAMMIDISGSMGSNTDPASRMSLLIGAVKNLIGEFNAYNGGEIRVNFILFSTNWVQSFIFDATADNQYANALTYLNSITGNGFTNYEAPMQRAIEWLNRPSGPVANPIAGGENISYFISDGVPNRYLNNSGGVVADESGVEAMNQIRGSDGSNEIATLKAISEVIGVGISVGTSISNINQIDSDGQAINVDDPNDLNAAIAGSNPLYLVSAVGNDNLTGGEGNDLIFGDSVNTDALAASMGIAAPIGSGWDVFARLEAGQSSVNPAWSRANTLDYIRANATALSAETVGSGGGRAGGNDVIQGGGGDDVIFGQEGNDRIAGNAGNDLLYGGSGADDFIFDAANNGVDRIADFSVAQGDALDVSAMLTAFDPLQDSINDFVFATTVGGDTVIKVDVTGSGNFAGAQTIAILQGVTGITQVEDILSNNSGGNVA